MRQSAAVIKIFEEKAFFPRHSAQSRDFSRAPHFSTAPQSLEKETLTVRRPDLDTSMRVFKPQDPAFISTTVIIFFPAENQYAEQLFSLDVNFFVSRIINAKILNSLLHHINVISGRFRRHFTSRTEHKTPWSFFAFENRIPTKVIYLIRRPGQ